MLSTLSLLNRSEELKARFEELGESARFIVKNPVKERGEGIEMITSYEEIIDPYRRRYEMLLCLPRIGQNPATICGGCMVIHVYLLQSCSRIHTKYSSNYGEKVRPQDLVLH